MPSSPGRMLVRSITRFIISSTILMFACVSRRRRCPHQRQCFVIPTPYHAVPYQYHAIPIPYLSHTNIVRLPAPTYYLPSFLPLPPFQGSPARPQEGVGVPYYFPAFVPLPPLQGGPARPRQGVGVAYYSPGFLSPPTPLGGVGVL